MFEKQNRLSASYVLRTRRSGVDAPLYCRLFLNAERSHNFRTNVYVSADDWNQKLQGYNPEHPLAEALRQNLSALRTEFKDILIYQRTLPGNSTPIVNSTKAQWLAKIPIKQLVVSLTGMYDEYIAYTRRIKQTATTPFFIQWGGAGLRVSLTAIRMSASTWRSYASG